MDFLRALELVTLASYILVSFERQNRFSAYAGRNYFIVGSLPSAARIFACCLFYRHGGTVALQDLDLLRSTTPSVLERKENALFASSWNEVLLANDGRTGVRRAALIFIRVNLLFKLTAAPFHLWAPAVYGNAPTPSVAFLSIYTKGRVLFLLTKLLYGCLYPLQEIRTVFFILAAILTLTVGRRGAFAEKNIKRFFVYSSRGHVGFRLAGFAFSTEGGLEAIFHYLAVYIISSFIRWFILRGRDNRQKLTLSAFANLGRYEPLQGRRLAGLIFSRSGIPPFGGFFVKLDRLTAIINADAFAVAYTLLFFTVIGFFYYLRVIKRTFFDNASGDLPIERPRNDVRLWRIAIRSLRLLSYLVMVQQPLLGAQSERLNSLR
jgi:NADH-quinone oxidoreductase subunit N